jgi:hypothetical protein
MLVPNEKECPMSMPTRVISTRAGAATTLLAALALGLGACSGVTASNIPTLPGNVPTVPPSGAAGACLDAQTLAIIDQLKASGADVPGIVAANKDKLVTGLGKLQSSDPAVVAWRDAFVTAIQAGKADDVAAQVALLSNGQVSGQVAIPPC